MTENILGIIGGSGLYNLPLLEDREIIRVETPFGEPSGEFIVGRIGKRKVVFIARHGRGHRLMPGEINYRANIWGLKKLGCREIVSVTAVGSMKEEIAPGDILIVDQFFDRTRQRPSTFFGEGIVAHIGFCDPVCSNLSSTLAESAEKVPGLRLHRSGTYICIEGPAFSTRAESEIFRKWGVDVIGMTNLPEARLAREAELCYGVLALVTDYDCWHEIEDDVSVQGILEVMKNNIETAKKIILNLAANEQEKTCSCAKSLDGAIVSDYEAASPEILRRLDLIIRRQRSEAGK